MPLQIRAIKLFVSSAGGYGYLDVYASVYACLCVCVCLCTSVRKLPQSNNSRVLVCRHRFLIEFLEVGGALTLLEIVHSDQTSSVRARV